MSNFFEDVQYYEPKSSIWMGVDALATSYPGMNPYNFTMGNPIMAIDPDGRQISPPDWVERSDGSIYWNEDVTSSIDKDLKDGETYRGKVYRRFEDIGERTYNDVTYERDQTISSIRRLRPDIDRIVTQDEARDWYAYGGGVPLTVDISLFKFESSSLSIEDFMTNSRSVDFFNGWPNHPLSKSIIWRPASDETLSDVYGTIRLAIVDRDLGIVRVVTDDATGFFDVFNYSSAGAVLGDRLRSNGNPTEFGFYGTGTATIRLKRPELKSNPVPMGLK